MDHRPDSRSEAGSVSARPERGRDSDIRLTMPARAENVALVRHVVAALAESLALPDLLIDDIRLAVTEACTNVVRHAYSGREGPIEVEVEPQGDSLTVVVMDHGEGIRPNPSAGGPGLGLPLIAALAHQLEIEHEPERGSRISMQFRSAGSVPAP
jgi:anti-sigma regulatory factor (Ser/Thr protein kinase)